MLPLLLIINLNLIWKNSVVYFRVAVLGLSCLMCTHMTFQDALNTAQYICKWTVVNYTCLISLSQWRWWPLLKSTMILKNLSELSYKSELGLIISKFLVICRTVQMVRFRHKCIFPQIINSLQGLGEENVSLGLI